MNAIPAMIFYKIGVVDADRDFLIARISTMKDLPALPVYVAKVNELLRKENVNVPELVRTLEHDPALVANILKIINSGYYGLRIKIDNVARAVALLGISGIRQIVYSVAVMSVFGKEEARDWAHSYSCSVLISRIVHEMQFDVAVNLPLTALLHDLGKVVLRRLIPELWPNVQKYAREKGVPIFEAESHIYHLNHAEAGQLLMQNWMMPADVIIPLAFHHIEDRLPDEFPLETTLLQIANYVDCVARGIICHAPKPGFLNHAHLLGFDFDYWIDSQRKAIPILDAAAL